MKPETGAMVKHGIWGLVIGAIITMIIGFAWGGWTTGGSSQRRSEEAVLATRAAICVAQFTKDPNYQVRLTEMKAVNSWDRANYIAKGGWDRMPGDKEANFAVSRACADGLEYLMEK
jgi:hypothetical protein